MDIVVSQRRTHVGRCVVSTSCALLGNSLANTILSAASLVATVALVGMVMSFMHRRRVSVSLKAQHKNDGRMCSSFYERYIVLR